jgi:hypothetical protein
MAERRNLLEGLKSTPAPANSGLEREFVFGAKVAAPPKVAASTTLARSPVSTRLREDYSKALKRASLERQLSGVQPNTLQDILEEALEPWLRANGYL